MPDYLVLSRTDTPSLTANEDNFNAGAMIVVNEMPYVSGTYTGYSCYFYSANYSSGDICRIGMYYNSSLSRYEFITVYNANKIWTVPTVIRWFYEYTRYDSRIFFRDSQTIDIGNGWYYRIDNNAFITGSTSGVQTTLFADLQTALTALTVEEVINYPITYRLTNCTAPSAPTEASVGDTVNVPLQFTTGYGIVNPSSDVYVTNNGVVVPSQYSDGVLTFTMPDPS